MKLLCLDIPQPGASLDKYQPHMLDEARHCCKCAADPLASTSYEFTPFLQ